MKEILAAFAAGIFRPVVTLLIPGFWVTLPFLTDLLMRRKECWALVNSHSDGAALAFIAIATAAGLILEDIGARIEIFFYRKHSKSDRDNWKKYLRLAPEREPIGVRYIRTLVLRLKFELGMGAAGLLGLIGILHLPIDRFTKMVLAGVQVSIAGYLLFEARSGVKVLAETRSKMFEDSSGSS